MTNTITSVFFIVFGLSMYFFVIPNQVEDPIFGGYTTPATIPNAVILGIVACGILQLLFERHKTPAIDLPLLLRKLLFGLVGGFAVWLMSFVGFLAIAPVLSLAIMLLIGERRLRLLALGIAIPIVVWYMVEIVLVRPLP